MTITSEASAWPNGVSSIDPNHALLVGLLLLVAAAGKSGMVPFSGWLPRAMLSWQRQQSHSLRT